MPRSVEHQRLKNRGGNGFGRIRAIFFVAALAFIGAQALLIGHASTHGEGPHDHGGQPCIVALAGVAGDIAVASAAVALVASFAVWRISHIVAQTERARIAVRAAAPRGPPGG